MSKTLAEELNELRAPPGNRWKEMEDPLGEARRVRGVEETAPDAEIAALRVRVEALEAGLREIEDWAPNWAQGVDENVDAIRDYARALLEGDDAIKDFARTLLEQKP